ncbi:hypothetical protein TrispH2_008944 [Trichoplax sp. H2]|nr:hypothetical protein TrispH2_008944 [Trichoplax sp. H2]|eukprot:RDD39251.1 hypothetical protein TrispH2_008944 [Trichoplax sp. H2]
MARNEGDHRLRDRFGSIFTNYLSARFLLNDNQERARDVAQFQGENYIEVNGDETDLGRGPADVAQLLINFGDNIEDLRSVTHDYIDQTLHLSIQEITQRYQWIVDHVLHSNRNNSFGRLVVLFYFGYQLVCRRWDNFDFKHLLREVTKTIIHIAINYVMDKFWDGTWDTVYENIMQIPFVQSQISPFRRNSLIAIALVFGSILALSFIRRT